MKMQISVIIMLFGLMLGLVEFSETYKIVKPYKYYNPHPRRPPRWHPFSKNRKHHPRKVQSHKHRPYGPDHSRYAPFYEDSTDISDDKPYVIVIQFPQGKEKKKHRHHQHRYPSQDIDYIDDDDDELKVYQLGNKKIQIEVNDRLSFHTS